uniref:SAM domain-containing protein n=1 Tax=Rodentolepis nana TaxID=102285 RepID=A0A0R3THT6_RODNA
LQKCNGGSKRREDVAIDATSVTVSSSTESIYATTTTTTTVVNSNEREEETEPEQQHQQPKRIGDVDCLNGGDRATMNTATTTPGLQVSSSCSNGGRKRGRPDGEMPNTEEGEGKKKQKKSCLELATPTSTTQPSQNGHKEHLLTSDETKSAAFIDAKSSKTAAAVAVSIATTATSAGIGGIKMTLHPVYHSSGEKLTSKPIPQHSSLTPPSPPPPSQPTVSSPPHLPSLPPPPPPPPPPPTTVSQIPIEVKQAPQPIHHSTPAVSSVAKPQATPQSSTSSLAPPPTPPLPSGPISKWTPRAVAEFVRGTSGCAPYADAFEINEVDGEALVLLSSSTSNFIAPPLSMKIGHALKLANRVKTLTSSSTSYSDTIVG